MRARTAHIHLLIAILDAGAGQAVVVALAVLPPSCFEPAQSNSRLLIKKVFSMIPPSPSYNHVSKWASCEICSANSIGMKIDERRQAENNLSLAASQPRSLVRVKVFSWVTAS
jgi:hypothetical protein